ncbi:unnamed protein product [Somion occarium]|uniref:Antiviral helicase n=1 Tax=Somion occarium TaxID=3059160 RepID=A0ABP1EBS6_9APHY
MDATDLFSFLNDNTDLNNDPGAEMDVEMPTGPNQDTTSKKRKADDSVANLTLSAVEEKHLLQGSHSPSESLDPISIKRLRVHPQPIVLDEVRIEAKRQIAGSVGLLGTAEATSHLELRHQVRHQVAIPPGYSYVPIANHIPPPKPAREYSFPLDPFQQVSIYAIQRNESVLVSAHTSAGKTVVAEYAIAQCLQNKQRVIYTSPIKALSNQKYRDLLALFGDVGLMTGDITINPSSSCLVMTTEILRSMLYRGSEIMREVAWVIFDEVHYMRDKERGVVWEETIILLPHAVRYVFLSATVPNAMQFAEWICKSHEQPCHVVYTDFRPTPLQHFLFPAGGKGIYLVVNEKGEFRHDNFANAMGVLQEHQGQDPSSSKSGRQGKQGKSKKGGKKNELPDVEKIVQTIMSRNYSPVIVFSFSKRECEAHAISTAKFEFNSTDEQDNVTMVFTNAINTLSEEDRRLPQIVNLLPLLKRGIGIHHGGLLPVLKEVTELLFQEGLVKVLFATETFSIGLNMPAKTVVFTSSRKFDGHQFRPLSSGEYIQMSGRAGRRGLDDRGVVVMMCDERLEPSVLKDMIKGQADRLDSAFHLGYNMILNLMKVEGISPEYLLEHSFYQFQSAASVPLLMEDLRREEETARSIVILDEPLVAEYYGYRQQLDQMASDFKDVITHPTYSVPFLNPGRLVKVKHGAVNFGWGVVLSFRKLSTNKVENSGVLVPQEQYVIDVLLNCASGSMPPKEHNSPSITPGGVSPCPAGQNGEPLVVPVLLLAIDAISSLRVVLPKDLRPRQARDTVWKSVLEVHRRMPDGIPLLDPISNMNITDDKFKVLVQKIELMESKLFASPLHHDPRLPELYSQYTRKMQCQTRVRELRKTIRAANDILQMEELKNRKRVLRRLGFVTSEDIVDLKGRVACEISTGDELLLTELIFNGTFNQLSPEQCAGLLSCFVFTEKSDQVTKLTEELATPLRAMQEIARRIAKVSSESKLTLNEDEYVQSFKVELMHVVVQWCRGASFSDICKINSKAISFVSSVAFKS